MKMGGHSVIFCLPLPLFALGSQQVGVLLGCVWISCLVGARSQKVPAVFVWCAVGPHPLPFALCAYVMCAKTRATSGEVAVGWWECGWARV